MLHRLHGFRAQPLCEIRARNPCRKRLSSLSLQSPRRITNCATSRERHISNSQISQIHNGGFRKSLILFQTSINARISYSHSASRIPAPPRGTPSLIHRSQEFQEPRINSQNMAVNGSARPQTRSHSGHSHSHDNTYLVSKNKQDAGVRITRIGLFVNLGMAISKGIGGVVFHSQG
jgi:hypothetical protein